MPIVKGHNARALTQSAVVLDLGDLDREAKRIVAEARVDGERIVTEATAEAQRLIDAADARGFEQGMERGLAEGREQGRTEGSEAATEACAEEFAAITDAWLATLDRWESEFNAMLHSARDDVLAFAFAMGRKITLRSIECDPTLVADQVAEALTYLSRPSSIKVVIHPDDRAIVERVLPELAARIDGCDHAAIEEDDGMQRGGCVLRTSRGVIDATIEKQIARIADALLPGDADGDRASDEPRPGA